MTNIDLHQHMSLKRVDRIRNTRGHTNMSTLWDTIFICYATLTSNAVTVQ